MMGGETGKRVLLEVKSVRRRVADMMMIRSGRMAGEDVEVVGRSLVSLHFFSRSLATRESTPMRTSVLTPRSCASSTTTTLYRLSRKSDDNSRKSTPSVMNLMAVSGDVVDEYRIW